MMNVFYLQSEYRNCSNSVALKTNIGYFSAEMTNGTTLWIPKNHFILLIHIYHYTFAYVYSCVQTTMISLNMPS